MDLGPLFGKNEIRGPLWESIGGITLLLAGVDLFLMMHPLAVATMRDISGRLMNAKPVQPATADWVTLAL